MESGAFVISIPISEAIGCLYSFELILLGGRSSL